MANNMRKELFMQLSVFDLRKIMESLDCKISHIQGEQEGLDETAAEHIAELSNDLYAFELLRDTVADEYHQRIKEIEAQTLNRVMLECESSPYTPPIELEMTRPGRKVVHG